MKASWMMMGIAVVSLGLMASPAGAANMTISVQLANGQTGQVAAVGDKVDLNVYAILTAPTAGFIAGDGLNQAYGGLKSSIGGLLGNLAFTLNPALTQTGSSNGTSQDLDVDTDLDVGGTSGNAAAGWISAQAGANVYSSPDANGYVLLGTATFTVTALASVPPDETFVNWMYRVKTTVPNTLENYKIGGQTFSLTGTSTSLGIGDSVRIFVPEPATMAVLALGGLGLLRRKKSA